MARRGPRSGDVDTRADILEAARHAFGQRGFHAATIRSIAAEADVDPALVMHYFDSKAGLFAESIDLPIPADAVESVVLADGIERAGHHLAVLYFGVWEDPDGRAGLLATLRNAMTHEKAAEALRDFFSEALLGPLAAHVDVPDADRRMALVASHLVGIALLRYVIGFEQLRDASVDELVALVGPRLQSYFTD
jgi:AcrR family transcriptional regulator